MESNQVFATRSYGWLDLGITTRQGIKLKVSSHLRAKL